MATLQQSLTFFSPVSQYQWRRPYSGVVRSLGLFHTQSNLHSSFDHRSLGLFHTQSNSSSTQKRRNHGPIMMSVKPSIQFIKGTDELTIPDIRLTKSRDGTNGVAIFRFEQPSVFDMTADLAEITGLYMIDDEGVLQSTNVSAKFVNGKPAGIESKYVMRTPSEWERFMSFMERYSNENGLQFIKK